MSQGVERAHALIARTADLFEAWDAKDRTRRLPALEAVFDALDEFREAEPVGADDTEHQLWTRAGTLAEGLDDLYDRATRKPYSADEFRTAQLAVHAALLQAQGQFDPP